MGIDEQEWIRRARRALRNSEDELSGATRARLRAARARALAGARHVARWPVLAAAVAAGIGAWLLVPRQAVVPPIAEPVNAVAMDALDVMADDMGPEFYENLEMYRWLEDEAAKKGTHGDRRAPAKARPLAFQRGAGARADAGRGRGIRPGMG